MYQFSDPENDRRGWCIQPSLRCRLLELSIVHRWDYARLRLLGSSVGFIKFIEKVMVEEVDEYNPSSRALMTYAQGYPGPFSIRRPVHV